MSTYFISTTGSDTNNGSQANPFLTLPYAISVASNGDTIKFEDGTYTINTMVSIEKQLTITSVNGKSNVTLTRSNIGVFLEIMSNNVTITDLTIEHLNNSDFSSFVINISRMSTGLTLPTIFTNINITNNIIKTVGNSISVNGSNITISGNTFTRLSGTATYNIILLNLIRDNVNILNNVYTETSSTAIIRFIFMSSSGSGSYLDTINSRGGILTINNNTIDMSISSSMSSSDIYRQQYFNAYNYGPDGENPIYNSNTKLTVIMDNNNIIVNNGIVRFMSHVISNNASLNMFNTITLSNNTISRSVVGIYHISSSSTITILESIINKVFLFYIYNNTISDFAKLSTVTGNQNFTQQSNTIYPSDLYLNENTKFISTIIPDTTPPTVGNSGTITKANTTSTAFDLSWTAATDGVTSQSSLVYAVYVSTTSSDVSSLANIDSSELSPTMSFTANTTTYSITGLSASTTYYYNVVVKDDANNRSIYTAGSETTLAQPIITKTSSLYYKQPIVILDNTASTNQTIASLVLSGGLSALEASSMYGVVSIKNTTQSTSYNSGSLIVDGGVGIAKNLNIYQELNVIGNSTFIGSISSGSIYLSSVGNLQIPISNITTGSYNAGFIRYNDTTFRYEGYVVNSTTGNSWKPFGGVIDMDGNTYITAEESYNENYLRFYTDGVERFYIDNSGGSKFFGAVTMGGLQISNGNLNVALGNMIDYSTINMTPNLGDIHAEETFTWTNGTAITTANVEITGLSFDNILVRGFNAFIAIDADNGTNKMYSNYEIKGIQKGTTGSWYINSSYVGDKTGIVFDISNTGQLRFSNENEPFEIISFAFRALTTNIPL